jgi:cytochrome c556
MLHKARPVFLMAALLASLVAWNRCFQPAVTDDQGIAPTAARVREVAEKKNRDKKIHELMEKVHEGRRSPLAQLKTQLGANATSWDLVDKQLPQFAAMSKALREATNDDVRAAADGYVGAVKTLEAAAKRRNQADARQALKELTSSCRDCHFKGGPGGKLD